MNANTHRPQWKTLLAFAIIYFVWGSTFLAIRIGVREVPPFLLAAMRFTIAGLALYGWMIAHGEPSPTRRQWTCAVQSPGEARLTNRQGRISRYSLMSQSLTVPMKRSHSSRL